MNFWGPNFGDGPVPVHGDKLVGIHGGATLSQTVGTEPGKIYRLSLYVRGLQNVPISGYRIKVNDKTLFGPKTFSKSNTNDETKTYKFLSMNFVADSEETKVSIKNIQSND